MASQTLEVATRGDAILVVGSGISAQKIKVDTVFLKAASETFRAMFGAQFSDGQGLSYEDPKEIQLPEDDPTAMKTICNVVHHKNCATLNEMSAGEILAVAITVDKYSMHESLFYAGNMWLANATDKPEDSARLVTILQAAYYFDNAAAIKIISKTLVLNYPGAYFSLLEHQDVPEEIFRLVCKFSSANEGNPNSAAFMRPKRSSST